MTTELATMQEKGVTVAPESELATRPKPPLTSYVVARNPQEMRTAVEAQLQWFALKRATADAGASELERAVDQARRNKWAITGLARQLKKANARVLYYSKIITALEEGYFIIPAFPVSLIAIRTDKEYPNFIEGRVSRKWYLPANEQSAKALDEGEGEFKNPFAKVESHEYEREKDGKRELVCDYHSSGWDDIDVPLQAAVPVILSELDRALQMKVFDEIGFCPPVKRPDPMIIGRIIDPFRPNATMSFLLAWWLKFDEV